MTDLKRFVETGEGAVITTTSKRSREMRGDKASHSFHGNQHTGGKGGGGYSSMKVLGNVVVPPGGPSTSKEYAAALRQSGYKGPLSYPKGKLKELYDTHVTGKTESVNVEHAGSAAKSGVPGYEMHAKVPTGELPEGTVVHGAAGTFSQQGGMIQQATTAEQAKFMTAEHGVYLPTKSGSKYTPEELFKKGVLTKDEYHAAIGKTGTPAAKANVAMSHKGVDYEKESVGAPTKAGAISVIKTPNGEAHIKYFNGSQWVPAGPGTTAAFSNAPTGKYSPIGGTIKQGASIPTASGHTVTAGSKITTSVKTLPHEVDAATSHAIGERNWKAGYAKQHSPAIKSYSGSGSTSINASMQNGTPNTTAKAMHSYILKQGHQLDEKITVDRGIGGPHATALKNLKAGSEIEYKSFASTTYAQVAQPGHSSVAASFGGGATVMRITVPKGTRVGIGVYGAHSSGLPGNEKELILPPGRFRVSHVSEQVKLGDYGNVGTIIHMEYLGAT